MSLDIGSLVSQLVCTNHFTKIESLLHHYHHIIIIILFFLGGSWGIYLAPLGQF
jgi:hypothetical protein